MQLSPHFTLEEMVVSQTAARLGIDNSPPPDVVANLRKTAEGLESVRALLGVPIHVNSGYRCLKLNAAVGSKPTSQHVLGQAADIIAPDFGDPVTVISKILNSNVIEFDQLILEFDQWVHISFAANPRKQVFRIDTHGVKPLWG